MDTARPRRGPSAVHWALRSNSKARPTCLQMPVRRNEHWRHWTRGPGRVKVIHRVAAVGATPSWWLLAFNASPGGPFARGVATYVRSEPPSYAGELLVAALAMAVSTRSGPRITGRIPMQPIIA